MKIIAVSNRKGGVGKSTTAEYLARTYASRGRTVLAIDLDPQGDLTRRLGVDPAYTKAEFKDWIAFSGGIPRTRNVLGSGHMDVRLMASNEEDLSSLDMELTFKPQLMQRLRLNILQQIDRSIDEVIIDCPPNLGNLTVLGYLACDILIVPTLPETDSIRGVDAVYRLADLMKVNTGHTIRRLVLPTMVESQTVAHIAGVAMLVEHYKKDILPMVPKRKGVQADDILTSHYYDVVTRIEESR